MTVEFDQSCLHLPAERRAARRSYRVFLVTATSAIAGLAATGPALAADEPPTANPPAAVPALPDIAPAAIPIPEIPPPELLEPPVVVTHVDAENIDVSIRVLSPGEDGDVAQKSETTVVSPASGAGITAEAEEVEPGDAEDPEPSGPVNTNVSVRVLSPGDRGDVTQDTVGGGEGGVGTGAGPPAPRPDAAPVSAPPTTEPQDPEQYHADNSQYQSPEHSWHWRWILSMDCAGNASSTSTESGRQESLIWSWEWVWEWCGEESGPGSESTTSSPPPTAAKPSQQDASSGEPAVAAPEPWSWTWTFTFCGESRTITTRSGTGTPLTWTWDWSWTWSCESAGATEAAPGPVVVPPDAAPPVEEEGANDVDRSLQVADEPATEELSSVWFPSFTMTGGRNAATASVWPSIPDEPPLEITVEVAIPPVVLAAPTAPPLTSPVAPIPADDVSAEPTSVLTPRHAAPPPPRQEQAPESTWNVRPEAATPAVSPRAHTHHARPAKHVGAKARRGDRSQAPFSPFDGRQPRQAAGGTSNAGGFVPSALLFGVAALTGFIVLAAPGLGRRIRVARELSPRGLEESPLDRPG